MSTLNAIDIVGLATTRGSHSPCMVRVGYTPVAIPKLEISLLPGGRNRGRMGSSILSPSWRTLFFEKPLYAGCPLSMPSTEDHPKIIDHRSGASWCHVQKCHWSLHLAKYLIGDPLNPEQNPGTGHTINRIGCPGFGHNYVQGPFSTGIATATLSRTTGQEIVWSLQKQPRKGSLPRTSAATSLYCWVH